MSMFCEIRGQLGLIGPELRLLWISLLALTAGKALVAGAVDPLLTYCIIDSLARRNATRLLCYAGVSAITFTGVRLVNVYCDRLTYRLKTAICTEMTVSALRSYYRWPYPEVERLEKGYFTARIYDDPLQVAGVPGVLVRLFASALMLIGAAGVCWWLSWQLALVITLVIPCLQRLSSRFGQRIGTAAAKASEADARFRATLGRAVDAYKTVNVFYLEGRVTEQVDHALQYSWQRGRERIMKSAIYQAVSGTLLSYSELSVLVGAGAQVLLGYLTIGQLFGFMSAYAKTARSFEAFVGGIPDLAAMEAQRKRTHEFATRAQSPEHRAATEMRVSEARYSVGGTAIFEYLEFSLLQGERVVMTGPNGSGKSTLLHILTRFVAVDSGETRLPGRGNVSALLTPCHFIPGTVLDNLNYDELPTARQVRCIDLARRLGVSSMLGTDPVLLSEGEKRRVQILMTLSKPADFYLLDEPLSGIDDDSTASVMDVLFTETTGKGLLVVMHGHQAYWNRFDRLVKMAETRPATKSARMNMP